jgi:cold shock CspA family protein/ribosome-associated translation inhibitor RaiA
VPERASDLGHANGAVHTLRRVHLISPARAALPTLADELLRCGGKRIRHRFPDILLAVAVEIDGIFVELRGQELGQTHGAAPGAAHIGELDVPFLQHLERVQQLLPKEVLPPAVISLRGEHGDGVLRQLVAAERGLAPPDREEDIARHAELLLDRGKRPGMLGGELFALRGEVGDVRLLDVVGRRLHEFSLPARRRAFPARKIEIRQRQIRLDPARRRIEGPARDAQRLRLRPQVLEPFLKARISRSCRGERGCRKPKTHDDSCIRTNSTHVTALSFDIARQRCPSSVAVIRCNDSRRPDVNKRRKSAQDMEPPVLQVPLEIAFHNIESSQWAEQEIRARVADLERIYGRLISCRVRIDQRAKDLSGTIPPVVHIELGIPGRNDLVVSHEPEHLLRKYRHPDLHKAINEAFRIAERQLLDLKEQRDGRTKASDHDTENQSLGQIAEITPEQDFGFLLTKEGGLLYFHRNALLSGDFDQLERGQEVYYNEDMGDTGPIATKVRVKSKSSGTT